MDEPKKPFTIRLSANQRAFVERKAAEGKRKASAWMQLLIDREIKTDAAKKGPKPS